MVGLLAVGEYHRHNCESENHAGCTVLLWSGHERARSRNGKPLIDCDSMTKVDRGIALSEGYACQ